jgi:hypothetical protein
MRAGPRDKIRRTRRYSQRLRLSCILLTQDARQPQPWLIFNVRRASAVESLGRRCRALVVLGPMAVSVLEFIRCATRAERGVGDSAADSLSDLRARDSGRRWLHREWRASPGFAWFRFAIELLVGSSRPSRCPSARLPLYRGYPGSPGC